MLQIEFTKGSDRDWITATRENGSVEKLSFPKKGVTVHDAIHYFVERALCMPDAFWGKIEQGLNPDEIQRLAKSGGHASTSRAETPDPALVQLIQAERIVECFEADAWGQPADPETFLTIARSACEGSHVPMPVMDAALIAHIRSEIGGFHADWLKIPVGDMINLEWRG